MGSSWQYGWRNKINQINTTTNYTSKDFVSDQEIRWCPGCGDFSILKQVQNVLPKLAVAKEKVVFVSGIGCSSRFPYYMNTNGIHSIHGRAPALATGLKLADPSLNVWIITGDGDALSIGGNHFIHLMKRNIDVNVLLFNNEIYGLTKGQFSPTTEKETITKTTPKGVKDNPINPLALALAAGATFIARSIDREAKHLQESLISTAGHKGTSLLEIYQNCHIFNDGAFDKFAEKKTQKDNALFANQGQPLIFGDGKALILEGLVPKVVSKAECDDTQLWIHDWTDRKKAMILAELGYASEYQSFPRVFGVIYKKEIISNKPNEPILPISLPRMTEIMRGKEAWFK